ncbi:hypothetical protein [Vallitalea guaymasensis]|uniref:Uncharacterized protein n=1 Tax=Vallitalea guaymasensis TaxID=1185412 RepID=A0A8J8MA43_9FIRM|nr:hypothetical protein [Vallitalea guaymasensis]QUH29177.1 hypothetical protein HYG85_09665 [Vallitalea guaymasensis]
MKDFLILCAKVALGIFIGFVLIFGGASSLKDKANSVNGEAGKVIDSISLSSTTTPSTSD